MVKCLMNLYLNVFGSKKKFCIVLKRLRVDFINFGFFSKRNRNRCEYGVKIYDLFLNYFFRSNNNALKMLSDILIKRQNNWINRPFLWLHFRFGKYLVIADVRKVGESLFLVFLKRSELILIGCFTSSSMLVRGFSSSVEIDPDLNQLIIEKLNHNKWPTDDVYIKKHINLFIRFIRCGILTRKTKQQLAYIEPFIFDIKNRIYAIDKIFNMGKSFCYSQVGYSDLSERFHKFILLRESKYSKLSGLPICKIVRVILSSNKCRERSIGIYMPIDKVLQQQFLTFLDVIIEGVLKPNVFAYRKGRDPRMAVASVYSILSRVRKFKDIYIYSVNLQKSFSKLLHYSILVKFPFPKIYKYLLFRWLKFFIVEKKNNFKNLGRNCRGVLENSILGPIVINFMLSQSFPSDVILNYRSLGKASYYRVWVTLVSYAKELLVISNNLLVFEDFLCVLNRNLKDLGLSFVSTKIKNFSNKKVYFYFLGFEFIIMFCKQVNLGSFRLNKIVFKKFYKLDCGFYIILRPIRCKFKDIQVQVKKVISLIYHIPRILLYKVFSLINFLVLGWSSYFSFSFGYFYAKQLDYFVYYWIKKSLIKKFRYSGIIRSKWVACKFSGFNKLNPNGKVYQYQVLSYFNYLSKFYSRSYIWGVGDIFSKLSIASFLISKQLCAINYYNKSNVFRKFRHCIRIRRFFYKL